MIKQDYIYPEIPQVGFLRLSQVLRFIPIGKSTWWAWVASGKAPLGVKIGAKTTVWKTSDIAKLIDDLATGVK